MKGLAIRYKDEESPAASMAVVTRVAFVIYATIPIYLASIEFYHRVPFDAATTGVGYLLTALLVICTAVDFRRTSTGHADRLRPWFSFFQICLAIAIVLIVNLVSGGAAGTYYVLFLLPLLVAAIMGNLSMLAATWVLVIATLGIAVHVKGGHHAETLVWTLVVSGGAWAGAALAVHFAVSQLLDSITIARNVSTLATTAQTIEAWPDELDRCLPLVAAATASDEVVVFAGPAGSALEPVASYNSEISPAPAADAPAADTSDAAGGSRTSLGSSPAVFDEGIRRARDARRVVRIDQFLFIPNRTTTGTDIVIATFRRRMSMFDVSTSSSAVTVGQLIGAIAERSSLIGGLREEAVTDPLTGLANRRTMQSVFEHLLAHAARTGAPCSVAMIDIDQFKAFNDHHGHLAGDDVLRSYASLLLSGVRGQDVVIRFGGEEFCLLLPETDLRGARTLLRQLRAGLAWIERPADAPPLPTFSAGVATWDRTEDRRTLLQRADRALYRAKATGRDRVASHPEDEQETPQGHAGAGPVGTTPSVRSVAETAASPPTQPVPPQPRP